MRRFWIELLLWGAFGVALGLGVAWAERSFGIPKNLVQLFWIALMAGALGFAAWAGWSYYRAQLNDDEWE